MTEVPSSQLPSLQGPSAPRPISPITNHTPPIPHRFPSFSSAAALPDLSSPLPGSLEPPPPDRTGLDWTGLDWEEHQQSTRDKKVFLGLALPDFAYNLQRLRITYTITVTIIDD
ncbi:hypothetical protein VTL71DRAFT_12318 [Oculimacula yallundae]|uniref:Uncharacterized protein n=1 Tax=Oculimacula yallundae TaxID=86028 RepID=A0ABR4CMB8_9HELO